jgi:LysR family transcriptional regulator, nitrogen assimilation regulatory protein
VLDRIRIVDRSVFPVSSGSFRDIRLFVAAYEERSFTAAARREDATQSGVSQHIRKLEDSLRASLFVRSKGRVVATPAGDGYYRHCIELLNAHAKATADVRRHGTGLQGDIVIGLMPTMTRCALAPVLARFIDTHSNVVVRVVEGYSAALTEQVLAGQLEFAVVPAFSGAPGLKSRLFLRTPELLVSSRRSPLTHLAPARLSELGPLKLVVPSQANTRRRLIETYLASNGVRLERLLELDAMLGTLDFVARTDWLAILPALMMGNETRPRLFCVNPIVSPPFGLDLVLIEPSRRPMAPSAQAFLQMLEDESSRINRRWEKLVA